ncbi:MAG: hypothetical protein KDD64_00930 [Bdellovibrionales bacterium]|nr:hypothetical protein [Bdellovibrionales bacterium]
MVFADADFQADIAKQALDDFKFQQTSIRYQATAQEMTEGLWGESLSPEQILDRAHEALKRDFFRSSIAEVLEQAALGNELSPQQVSQLSSLVLEHTSPVERAQILNSLLSGTVEPEDVQAVALVLTIDHYGKLFTGNEGKDFFKNLGADSVQALGKLLALSPTSLHAEFLAGSWIDSEVQGLIDSLPPGSIRDELSQSENVKERLAVLEHVSSEARIQFCSRILSLAGVETPASIFVSEKLDNALQFLSPAEKTQLTVFALESNLSDSVDEILRACDTLEELSEVVSGSGIESLLSLQNSQVNELVAQSILGSSIREIEFRVPTREEISTEGGITNSLNSLLDQMEIVRTIVSSHPELGTTATAQEYLATIVSNLSELNDELSQASGELSELQDIVQRYWKMAELEFRYGIDISNTDSFAQSDQVADLCHLGDFGLDAGSAPEETTESSETARLRWEMRHLEQIERVLERIPEAELLFTPMLHRVELVDSLGWGVLGARYHANGVIQIAELALDHTGMAQSYQGENSLAIVLAHEMGHGVQIGDGPAGIYYPTTGQDPYFGGGEAIHNFDEWMKLSDWTVYDRSRYEPSENAGYVVVDGQELKVGQPVAFNGKTIVLTYNQWYDVLYSYDAESDFSNRWYAKSSPWEDFAEAFSEYLFLPERLIQDAPEKFKHLDLEFRRYADDSRMQQLLRDSEASHKSEERVPLQ